MRPALALALLAAAAALPRAAHADPAVTFNFDYFFGSSDLKSIDFTLDPATYTDHNGAFQYTGVPTNDDGTTELDTVDFSPFYPNILLTTPNAQIDLTIDPNNGVLPLAGDPSTGLPPTITLGTYTFPLDCIDPPPTASLHTLLPTLAMLDIPAPIPGCTGVLQLEVTSNQPASTTPEPSTLALLSTGLLGTAALLRRRLHP